MKTTSLSHMIGARSDVHRAPVVFLVLVAVFNLGSCGGKKEADVLAPDADTTRRNPEVVDGTATPDMPVLPDTKDAPDNGEVAGDIEGQDKVDADTPGPDGEVAQPPALFPYKLAATYVLQQGEKIITTPSNLAVGANGSLLCVPGHFPDAPRTVLCYRVGLLGEEPVPVNTTNLDEALASLLVVVVDDLVAGSDPAAQTGDRSGERFWIPLAELVQPSQLFHQAKVLLTARS